MALNFVVSPDNFVGLSLPPTGGNAETAGLSIPSVGEPASPNAPTSPPLFTPAPIKGRYNGYHPDPNGGPVLRYSPGTHQLFVNGATFKTSDALTALASLSNLKAKPAPLPASNVTDWQRMSLSDLSTYIHGIQHPGTAKLFEKNFVAGLNDIRKSAGELVNLAGAPGIGSAIAAPAERNIQQLSPYQRDVLKIASAGDAANWAVASAGRLMPTLLELAGSAFAGFAASGSSAVLQTGLRALSKLALDKGLRTTVERAVTKRLAGEALTSEEALAVTNARGLIAGAAAVGADFGLNTADVYSAVKANTPKGEAPGLGGKVAAIIGGAFGTALDFTPTYLLAKELARKAAVETAKRGAFSAGRKVLATSARHSALFGASMAAKDVATSSVVAAETGSPMSHILSLTSVVNSLAGGALFGAVGGAAAGLRGSRPVDLTDTSTVPVAEAPLALADRSGVKPPLVAGRAKRLLLTDQTPTAASTPEVVHLPDLTKTDAQQTAVRVAGSIAKRKLGTALRAARNRDTRAFKSAKRIFDAFSNGKKTKVVGGKVRVPGLADVKDAVAAHLAARKALETAAREAGTVLPDLPGLADIHSATASKRGGPAATHSALVPVTPEATPAPASSALVPATAPTIPDATPKLTVGNTATLKSIAEDTSALLNGATASLRKTRERMAQLVEATTKAPTDKARAAAQKRLAGVKANFGAVPNDMLVTMDKAHVLLAAARKQGADAAVIDSLRSAIADGQQAIKDHMTAMSEQGVRHLPPPQLDTTPEKAAARLAALPTLNMDSTKNIAGEILTLRERVNPSVADSAMYRAGVSALMDIADLGRGTSDAKPKSALAGNSAPDLAKEHVLRLLREDPRTKDAVFTWAKQQTHVAATDKAGAVRPAYEIILEAGIYNDLKAFEKHTTNSFSIEDISSIAPDSEAARHVAAIQQSNGVIRPEHTLGQMLDALAAQENPKASYTPRVRALLSRAVVDVEAAGKDLLQTTRYRSGVLADYVDRNGRVTFARTEDGGVVLSTLGGRRSGNFSLRDFNNPHQISDGSRVSAGRAMLLVRAFMARVRVPHDVTLIGSVENLRASNPRLFEQARAAYPGDFAAMAKRASGYSFGGKTIIFTDNIHNEAHLKFVLAHEVIGHYGFKSVIPPSAFHRVLDEIYTHDASVRASVDESVAARGLDRRTATEEYLADMAGAIDGGLLTRLWFAIKGGLEKVGVRFGDEMARYWIRQARRYVRTGDAGVSFVIPSEIGRQAHLLDASHDPLAVGRFASVGEVGNIVGKAPWVNQGHGTTLDALLGGLKKAKVNTADLTERLLTELKTLNFSARENFGYRQLFHILRDTSLKSSTLRTKYQRMMHSVFNPALEAFGARLGKGATREGLNTANEMLITTSIARHNAWTPKQIAAAGDIVHVVGDSVTVDNAVLAKLRRMGRLTLDDFRKGAAYTLELPREMTRSERAALIAERDMALQQALADGASQPAIDTLSSSYDAQLSAGITYDKKVVRMKPMPKLTRNSLEWRIYTQVRDTVETAAIDTLLANFKQAQGERARVLASLEGALGATFSARDKAFLTAVSDKYIAIRSEGAATTASGSPVFSDSAIQDAQDFMVAFNRTMLSGTDVGAAKAFLATFDRGERGKINEALRGLRAKVVISGEHKFDVQHEVLRMAMSAIAATEAVRGTTRTIASGHVPFERAGTGWQVRTQILDANGNPMQVADSFAHVLPYFQVDTKGEAQAVAATSAKLFDTLGTKADGTGVGPYHSIQVIKHAQNRMGERTIETTFVRAKLAPVVETAQKLSADPSGFDVHEFVRIAGQYGIAIPPQARERLIVGLTRQDANIRHSMQRNLVPGFDRNVIKSTRMHLESVAASVAKRENKHRIAILFDKNIKSSRDLWFGNASEYAARKAAWKAAAADPTVPEAAKIIAKRKFDRYHFFYKTHDAQKMGNRYRDRALRELTWLDSQRSIEFSDFGSGALASKIKLWTVLAQMGGSVATGMLNYISVPLNGLPALAGYNPRKAFGGGYGFGPAAQALTSAMLSTMDHRLSDASYYKTESFRARHPHITPDEARFMQGETANGIFQAAQQTSLIGSARGNIKSSAMQHLVKAWMYPFSVTEEGSRRAVGLAAYRLEHDRQTRAGATPELATKRATEMARTIVEQSLGEYAMFNRPAMFRGGLQQFLFIYKMFVVTSIQLMSALPAKERAGMALGLVAMSGVSGLPFGQDLLDIITTIMQTLGLKQGNPQRALVESANKVMPGLGRFLLEGAVNPLVPGNIASRISLGDVLPGTGIGIAGANVARNLIDIGGPAASLVAGTVSTAAQTLKLASKEAGVAKNSPSVVDILRKSPVTMGRALGDTLAYTHTGAVLDSKGYVASPDLTTGVLLARVLGFYPASSSIQNEVIKLASVSANYQKDVTHGFILAYVKAKLNHDAAALRRLNKALREWNTSTRGTIMHIDNFYGKASRAYRMAKQTSLARALKSLPRNQRGAAQSLAAILGQ